MFKTLKKVNTDSENNSCNSSNVLGFWIYIMSDCVLFSILFATYAVLCKNFAVGPTGKELFNLPFILIETFVLLVSSFMIGISIFYMQKKNKIKTIIYLLLTIILGTIFVSLESIEFHHFINKGATPNMSAFLSAFFTLVGTHCIHVIIGIFWGIILIIKLYHCDFKKNNTGLICLSLFWHFLHIIWICVFTIIYLMGVI
ncbi:Ubiquinol oxidase subunit 3 [Candidatus Johnevansia muelleri]|uniref:Cytochrome bo(3) ubiquinol oxidase subunit 3 n=1 Tax=Candidatus Johnevansia muelleri TaxID=1495769 RepID=A0A078KE92_9GAMM|nr:Ubiquinol oxidase subunit 3 [Candidatus Evansia muelleri]